VIAIRYLALAVPLAVVGIAAWQARPDRRGRGAALLGFITAAVGLAAVNAVAARIGWWSYATVDGAMLGMPVDLWLGWAALWGALPVLVRVRLPILLAAWLWLDAVAMPAMAPLLRLSPHWLVGEAVALAVVALPAGLLGRWVADSRRLRARATAQFLVFAALICWLLPAIAIDLGDGSWAYLLGMPRWQASLAVQVTALAALPGLSAMREFASRGGGTPYPWDPPDRLVTTGPYAYVANPMQLSAIALLLVVAAATHSWTVMGVAVSATAFGVAVAAPHEDVDLTRRHGAAWSAYRAQVRAWWPRWRPLVAEPARLHLARTCDVCSSTAVALGRLGPTGLTLCPAEEHARPLRRARYEHSDGYAADGVSAVARGLEHVHLGWAVIGWALRLPVLDRVIQAFVDALGADPRELDREGGSTMRGSQSWLTPGRS
jgi:protein-S-isoprenylcysteine O-methyltransferase Ste14